VCVCVLAAAHGCALVISGVMIHGRMYLTEKNIYFRANIVGIVTKVSRSSPQRLTTEPGAS
jgi:hypothetical protein